MGVFILSQLVFGAMDREVVTILGPVEFKFHFCFPDLIWWWWYSFHWADVASELFKTGASRKVLSATEGPMREKHICHLQVSPSFHSREARAQRQEVTCPEPHSWPEQDVECVSLHSLTGDNFSNRAYYSIAQILLRMVSDTNYVGIALDS
jgi:hypothetical protein